MKLLFAIAPPGRGHDAADFATRGQAADSGLAIGCEDLDLLVGEGRSEMDEPCCDAEYERECCEDC